MEFLAQAQTNIWNGPNGSITLLLKIGVGILIGLALVVSLLYAPPRARRPIVGFATFIAGSIYVAQWLFPRAIQRSPGELPLNSTEAIAFWLDDAVGLLGDVSNTLAGLLLGLGVFSLLSIHCKRLFRMQKDWAFSLVLLLCMVVMVLFGYANWISRQGPAGAALSASMDKWTTVNYVQDFLFDGLLQQMDAAMFSIIAFYILSAAYRAFRIRSIEATILLATALVVMLSLMGAVEFSWNNMINTMAHNNDAAFIQNFTLTSIRNWIGDNIQNPSLRAIDFGIGIGALAMALRLWLSLEKSGVNA